MQLLRTQNKEIKILTDNRAHWFNLGSVLVLIGIWYLFTEVFHAVNPLFIPSPVKVAASAVDLINNGLANDIIYTVLRVMVSFFISIAFALPVGLLISESNFIKKLLMPYIDFIRYIPVPVLIPLTILFFGIGELAKIVLLFIGTFFQIVLLFMDDLARVPKEYFDLAFTLNFTSVERLKMKVQSSLPSMYDNMRISLGLSWSYVIIAELVASDVGLGHMIKEAQRFSHTAEVYVGILVMGLIGFISDYIFRKSYNKFFPYMK